MERRRPKRTVKSVDYTHAASDDEFEAYALLSVASEEEIVRIPQKRIELIVAQRPLVTPGVGTVRHCEYLVKYFNMSYLHLEWLTAEKLLTAGPHYKGV
jgi:hypothetical protein